jgi:hypothetical protein
MTDPSASERTDSDFARAQIAVRRRELLAATAAGGLVTTAGCLESLPFVPEQDPETAENGDEPDPDEPDPEPEPEERDPEDDEDDEDDEEEEDDDNDEDEA